MSQLWHLRLCRMWPSFPVVLYYGYLLSPTEVFPCLPRVSSMATMFICFSSMFFQLHFAESHTLLCICRPGFKLLDLDVSHPKEVRPTLEQLLKQCHPKSNPPETYGANSLTSADSPSLNRKSSEQSSRSGDHEIGCSSSRTTTAKEISPLALVVDGSSLEMCLATERDLFVKLFQKYVVLLSCRGKGWVGWSA